MNELWKKGDGLIDFGLRSILTLILLMFNVLTSFDKYDKFDGRDGIDIEIVENDALCNVERTFPLSLPLKFNATSSENIRVQGPS